MKLNVREAKGFPQIIFLNTNKTAAVYASPLQVVVSNIEWRPGNANHILSVLIYEYTKVTDWGHWGFFMQNFSNNSSFPDFNGNNTSGVLLGSRIHGKAQWSFISN